jgi:hypothetical protein
MASTYPNTLDAFATNRSNTTVTDTTHPGDHNNANDAINKIEAELGITPKGTFSDVAARLAARSTVRLTADSSAFTTQTLTNVTGLSFSVAASQDYRFYFMIPVTLGTARGVGVAVTCPATPTGIYYEVRIGNVTATTEGLGYGFASAALVSSAASATTNGLITISGILSNGATAGTLQVQLRQGTGATAANVVAKKGAYGEMYLN